MKKEDSALYCSRQAWKVQAMNINSWVFCVLMVALQVWGDGLFAGYHNATLLALCGLWISGIALACNSVKCPACKAKWLWMAVGKKSVNSGTPWLHTFSACPECGYDCRIEEDVPEQPSTNL